MTLALMSAVALQRYSYGRVWPRSGRQHFDKKALLRIRVAMLSECTRPVGGWVRARRSTCRWDAHPPAGRRSSGCQLSLLRINPLQLSAVKAAQFAVVSAVQ